MKVADTLRSEIDSRVDLQQIDAADLPPGLGLVGMRERVLASGGHLEAGPDGAGTFRVRVELPSSSRAAL